VPIAVPDDAPAMPRSITLATAFTGMSCLALRALLCKPRASLQDPLFNLQDMHCSCANDFLTSPSMGDMPFLCGGRDLRVWCRVDKAARSNWYSCLHWHASVGMLASTLFYSACRSTVSLQTSSNLDPFVVIPQQYAWRPTFGVPSARTGVS
jgi:hypothetical protein